MIALKRVQRSSLVRYSISLVVPLVALLATIAAKPMFAGKAPLTFFTLGVVGVAAFGGFGPGLATTFLSFGIVRFVFPDSIFSLLLAQSSLVSFTILGITVSLVLEKFHRTNAALQQAKSHLEIANRELSERTEALARSNQELERFAYALSHDLQTPLRTIGLHTEFLVQRRIELSDEEHQAAEFIVAGVERMQSMIRGLLDYSTATDDHGVQERTDCNDVVRIVLEDLSDDIRRRKACVTSDLLPVVHANPGRLAQVFSNLISNALKYHDSDPPSVHIAVREEDKAWILSVHDNGIGIDMRHAEQIFRVFERLHSSDVYEGSGIGLAICRAIIHRHGGRIWVESEPGKGSTFYFTLPKADNSPDFAAPNPIDSAGAEVRTPAV